MRRRNARGDTGPVCEGTGLGIQVVRLQSPTLPTPAQFSCPEGHGAGHTAGFQWPRDSPSETEKKTPSWDWPDTHKRKDPSVAPPGRSSLPYAHLPTAALSLLRPGHGLRTVLYLTVSSPHRRTRAGLESLTACSPVPAVCRARSSGLKSSTLQDQEMLSLLLWQEEGTG